MNPLLRLQEFGQSFWYDNIRRRLLNDGTIKKLIDEDGLRGMTSNPSIFDKAIGQSNDYDEQITRLINRRINVKNIYEELAITDIRLACDLFQEVFHKTSGADGFVSLEVSPHLAHDYSSTVEEAQRLFHDVARPNLMVKVPATDEGIPAVCELISRGVNINITLMFSMDHYEAVADAYIQGIDSLLRRSGDASKVSSVASFFVSRVDTAVDKLLEAIDKPEAQRLLGKAAVSNSKLVYQRYKERFNGSGFAPLSKAGARRQRLLWASTSTKNPEYPDTLYVDELIGAETVNTMPPATIDAFRDHGKVTNSLESDLDEARSVLESLSQLGIDLDSVTKMLQLEGVEAFARSFDQLISTLEKKVEVSS